MTNPISITAMSSEIAPARDRSERRLLFVIFFAVVILDQLTKFVASSQLPWGVPNEVIPGLFNFTLVHNPGAAFGMFGSLPPTSRRLALGSVSLLAFGVIFWFLVHDAKDDRVARCALVGILGGAVGNLIDRLRFDYVVDFLDFYWGTYHWPAFNIADSAICIGVAVLIFRSLRPQTKRASHEVESAK